MNEDHIQSKLDAKLDAMLTGHLRQQADGEDASAARVLAALAARPLPRQHRRAWSFWPNVLLDWDFTPAWPRVAMLAGCAALGFLIGLAGLDGQFDDASATTVAAADLSSIVFESEPLTGLRP